MILSGADTRAIVERMVKDATAMGLPIGRLKENKNPTLEWLDEQCARLGFDFASACRRAYADGAIAAFVADAEAVEARYGRPHALTKIEKRIQARECPARESPAEGFDAQLERLDSLRYDNPRRAAKLAKQALQDAGGPVAVAQLLGIMGSAHRTMFRFDWSMVELGLAITLAEVAGRRDVVARLARRAACVMVDRGLLDQAEAISREALALYNQLGNDQGAARCRVDLAMVLNKQGLPAAALQQSRTALALNVASRRSRCAAHQLAAIALLKLEDLDGAEREAERAAAIQQRDRFGTGLVAWVRGRIAWKRGELARAERFYASAFRLISEPAADRLVIGAERVRVILKQGNVQAAAEEARALFGLHGALERDTLDEGQVLSTAALELSLAARRAELTAEGVDAILAEIEAGLAARVARLRERLRP